MVRRQIILQLGLDCGRGVIDTYLQSDIDQGLKDAGAGGSADFDQVCGR